MTCVIVEDEPHVAAALRGMLADCCPEVIVLAELRTVPEAVLSIKEHKPQLVLLDMEMPVYSGLDLFRFLDKDERTFQTIFVTGYKDFALAAFEVSAADYLLKPVNPQRLREAINKVKTLLELQEPEQQEEDEDVEAHMNQATKGRIAFKTKRGIQLVELNHILCFEAQGAYTQVHLANGQKLMLSKNLAVYEKMVEQGPFMRVHRSYLVNPAYITEYRKSDGGVLVFTTELEIPVGQEGKQVVQQWLSSLTSD